MAAIPVPQLEVGVKGGEADFLQQLERDIKHEGESAGKIAAAVRSGTSPTEAELELIVNLKTWANPPPATPVRS